MQSTSKLVVVAAVWLTVSSCRNEFEAGSYGAKDGGAQVDGDGSGEVGPGPDLGSGGAAGGAPGSGGTTTLDASRADALVPVDGGAGDVPIAPGDVVAAGGAGGSGGQQGTGGATSTGGAGGTLDVAAAADLARQIDAPDTDASLAEAAAPDAGGATVPGTSAQGGTAASGGAIGTGGVAATGGGTGTGGAATGGGTGTPSPPAERYMILMDDQFLGHARLADFVTWKTEKGYDVEIVTTSMIDSGGAPSHDQVVAYLRGLPAARYPRYLLILGDADATNGVAAYKFQSTGVSPEYSYLVAYPQQYTDREIATRRADGLPTVFAGRLPASTSSELTVMLDKALLMDRTPPAPNTTAMYDRVLVAGELWPTSDGGRYLDRGAFAEKQDAVISYLQQAGNGTTYQVDLALVQETALPEDAEIYWSPSETRLWTGAEGAAQVLGPRVLERYFTGAGAADAGLAAALGSANAGAALLLFSGRAETNGWWRPEVTSAQIAANLHNGTNLPLVISDASLAGVYYPPTGDATLSPGEPFAKTLLTRPDGGAYAVIGATDMMGTSDFVHGLLMACLADYRAWLGQSTHPTFTGSLRAPDVGTIGINEGEATRLGQAVYFAQWYAGALTPFQLLGDPEAFVMLHAPLAQNVAYPAKTPPGDARSITVFTGEDGALVSLYGHELGVRAVGTTQDGLVTLPFAATTEGALKVTVSRPGRMPYQGVLLVTTSIPKGDVDGNGVIEKRDADLIANYSTDLPVYDFIPEAADVNCDGAISVVDAMMVAQIAAGMSPVGACLLTSAAD